MTYEEAINELKIEYVGEYEKERKAKNIAIEALEKQIPKKPIDNCFCPVCNRDVWTMSFGKKYCDCGQKMDWETLEITYIKKEV